MTPRTPRMIGATGNERSGRITRPRSGPSRRVSFLWFEGPRGAGSATDRHPVCPLQERSMRVRGAIKAYRLETDELAGDSAPGRWRCGMSREGSHQHKSLRSHRASCLLRWGPVVVAWPCCTKAEATRLTNLEASGNRDARLSCGRGSIVQALPQSGFPAPDTSDKKFYRCLVAPIKSMSGTASVDGCRYGDSMSVARATRNPSPVR